MSNLSRRKIVIGSILFMGYHSPAAGEPTQLPAFTLPVKIQGIDVGFPVALTLQPADPSGLVGFEAKVGLADLAAKIDIILRAAGMADPAPGSYKSFDYKNTNLAVVNRRLYAKVHFNVNPKIVPRTNGSVELTFEPKCEPQAVRLVAQSAKLNVSNDISRGAVKLLNYDRKLTDAILKAANEALSQPRAQLQLPESVAQSGGRFESAIFDVRDGQNVLIVTGKMDPTAALRKAISGG